MAVNKVDINGATVIDLTSDSVTPETLLQGATAHDASGAAITGTEVGVLIVGCLVSFLVSLLVIRGLMEYVRKHSFAAFGVYRIVLGVIVLVYFLVV